MSKWAEALIIAAALSTAPAWAAEKVAKVEATKTDAGKAEAAPKAGPIRTGDVGTAGIGRPALAEEIAAWNIEVRPDGEGLPDGKGSVKEGEKIFLENCAVCHGEFGEGAGRWPVLAGGHGTLSSDRPDKTIGSYWPYASTVFDYIHRAMPFGANMSLSADQTYAIVAYLLNLNDLVKDDFVLSKENFPKVEMPNQPNFFVDDRETSEKAFWKSNPCMTNCKGEVKVTSQARILDVTPDGEGGPKGNVE